LELGLNAPDIIMATMDAAADDKEIRTSNI
jgi:hypothetical protein